MKEVEINGVVYKIKEVISVRLRMKYTKILTKIQRKMMEELKKTNNVYDPNKIAQDIADGDYTVLSAINQEDLLDFELEQFKLLYGELVLEPKLTETEIEEMDIEVYEKLKGILADIINSSLSKTNELELKKKQDSV